MSSKGQKKKDWTRSRKGATTREKCLERASSRNVRGYGKKKGKPRSPRPKWDKIGSLSDKTCIKPNCQDGGAKKGKRTSWRGGGQQGRKSAGHTNIPDI